MAKPDQQKKIMRSFDARAPDQAYFDKWCQTMTDRHYLSIQEVARRFRVNTTTVYRLVKRGRLPAFKVGNQWRFSEERLQQWVADKERVG